MKDHSVSQEHVYTDTSQELFWHFYEPENFGLITLKTFCQ